MTGGHADLVMPFGKYQGMYLHAVPDGYLHYMLSEDWFEGKYPKLVEAFEDELVWRKEQRVTVEGD